MNMQLSFYVTKVNDLAQDHKKLSVQNQQWSINFEKIQSEHKTLLSQCNQLKQELENSRRSIMELSMQNEQLKRQIAIATETPKMPALPVPSTALMPAPTAASGYGRVDTTTPNRLAVHDVKRQYEFRPEPMRLRPANAAVNPRVVAVKPMSTVCASRNNIRLKRVYGAQPQKKIALSILFPILF